MFAFVHAVFRDVDVSLSSMLIFEGKPDLVSDVIIDIVAVLISAPLRVLRDRVKKPLLSQS